MNSSTRTKKNGSAEPNFKSGFDDNDDNLELGSTSDQRRLISSNITRSDSVASSSASSAPHPRHLAHLAEYKVEDVKQYINRKAFEQQRKNISPADKQVILDIIELELNCRTIAITQKVLHSAIQNDIKMAANCCWPFGKFVVWMGCAGGANSYKKTAEAILGADAVQVNELLKDLVSKNSDLSTQKNVSALETELGNARAAYEQECATKLASVLHLQSLGLFKPSDSTATEEKSFLARLGLGL